MTILISLIVNFEGPQRARAAAVGRELDKEEKVRRERDRLEKFRQERRNRDAFKELLKQHEEKGVILPKMLWKVGFVRTARLNQSLNCPKLSRSGQLNGSRSPGVPRVGAG